MKTIAISFGVVFALLASTAVAMPVTDSLRVNSDIVKRDDGSPQCTYTCNDAGQWILDGTPGNVSGCPSIAVVPSDYPTTQQYGCRVTSTPSLIGVSALNCAHVCILTSSCGELVDCQVPSFGTLINVSALNCAEVKILSTKRK